MRAACVMAAVIVSTSALAQSDAGAPWWDPAFSQRIYLSLDRFTPSATLVDFPLLVTLDASRFDRARARADLGDLRFVDLAGAVLPYELEPSVDGGVVLAWVRTTITADAGAGLYLYYSNPSATSAGASPWSANYVAVWHQYDDTDSVGAIGLTAFNVTVTAGLVGRAHDFNGTTSYLRAADQASLHWAQNEITVSGWIKLRAYQMRLAASLVARPDNAGTAFNDFFLGVASSSSHTQMGSGNLINGSAVSLNAWHHLASTFDGTTMRLYLDGVQTNAAPKGTALGQSARALYIGADNNSAGLPANNGFVDGQIDEVRIERVARPAGWIAAEVASMRDQWISYGGVELQPVDAGADAGVDAGVDAGGDDAGASEQDAGLEPPPIERRELAIGCSCSTDGGFVPLVLAIIGARRRFRR